MIVSPIPKIFGGWTWTKRLAELSEVLSETANTLSDIWASTLVQG